MCLASCSLTTFGPERKAFEPLTISTTSAPIEVTDRLVDVANYLLDDAPPAIRQMVFDLLGIEDAPGVAIPYLSVAYFMGRKDEHADAVRLLVGMSTLADVQATSPFTGITVQAPELFGFPMSSGGVGES